MSLSSRSMFSYGDGQLLYKFLPTGKEASEKSDISQRCPRVSQGAPGCPRVSQGASGQHRKASQVSGHLRALQGCSRAFQGTSKVTTRHYKMICFFKPTSRHHMICIHLMWTLKSSGEGLWRPLSLHFPISFVWLDMPSLSLDISIMCLIQFVLAGFTLCGLDEV